MVRDFDFISPPRKRRSTARRQPWKVAPRHPHAAAAAGKQPTPGPVPAKKFAIPPQNILDLRPVSRPIKPPKLYPTHTSLRDYHPLTPRRPKPEPQPAQPKPVNPVNEAPAAQPLPVQDKKQRKFLNKRTILGALLTMAGIIVMAGGLLTPLLQNPHIAVALYIPVALIFKLKSQTSFTLALLLLIAIPILIVFKQEALAETYAVFCFYFLVIGVVMAAFELRTSSRKTRSENL